MPFSRGLRREIIYICLSGIVALAIFFVARPMGFANLGNLTLIGFGGVSILMAILYLVTTHFLYQRYWSSRKWTLGLEILHSLFFLLFIAAGILIYGKLVGVTVISLRSSLIYFLSTLLLGLIPVMIRAILVRNWRLKQDLEEVKKLNELLGNKKAESEERLIEFTISKKETFRLTNQSLLFIESRENYLSVCWDTGKEIKKYMIRMTMKEAIRQINDPLIVFCHRSFIVNLRKVKEIISQESAQEMILNGLEKPIPLSNTFRKVIRQKLINRQTVAV